VSEKPVFAFPSALAQPLAFGYRYIRMTITMALL